MGLDFEMGLAKISPKKSLTKYLFFGPLEQAK
jgi:hypothetical protein